MNYIEFEEALMNSLAEVIKQYDVKSVELKEEPSSKGILKRKYISFNFYDNEEKEVGFSFQKIYPGLLFDLYEKCKNHGDMYNECEEFIDNYCISYITSILKERQKYLELFKLGKITEYIKNSKFSEKISFKMVNYSKNEEKLANYPHRRFLDLAVLYVIEIADVDTDINCYIEVTHENAKLMEMTEEQLYDCAYRNSQIVNPIVYKISSEDHIPMFVVTGGTTTSGASVLLYGNETFRRISDKCSANLYILPSSTEEILVLPEFETPMDISLLKEMVSDGNDLMEDEIVLSSNVYFYDRKIDRISVVNTEE